METINKNVMNNIKFKVIEGTYFTYKRKENKNSQNKIDMTSSCIQNFIPEVKYGYILVKNDKILKLFAQETELNEYIAINEINNFDVTKVVVSKNKLILPGLIDSHIHPYAAMNHKLKSIDIENLSLSSAIEVIKNHIKDFPDKQWYFFKGYSTATFHNTQAKLHYSVLDSVSKTKPIAIIRSDLHAWWVNSKVMEIANIDIYENNGRSRIKNPIGGIIERDLNDNIIGEFSDNAMGLINIYVPLSNETERASILKQALFHLVDKGITSFLDACVKNSMIDDYLNIYSNKELIDYLPRVSLAVSAQKFSVMTEENNKDNNINRNMNTNERVDYLDNQYQIYNKVFNLSRHASFNEDFKSKLKINTVKLFIDGVYESKTAFIFQNYNINTCKCGKELEEYNESKSIVNQGNPSYTQLELDNLFLNLLLNNLEIHCHTIGDQAIYSTLEAIIKAKDAIKSTTYDKSEIKLKLNDTKEQDSNSLDNHNITLAHIQVCRDSEMKLIKQHNIKANFSPLWFQNDSFTEEFETIISKDSLNNIYPIKTFLNNNITCGFGSDWPVSSEIPWFGIQTAITHKDIFDESKDTYNKNQVISLEEAIYCYTIGSASILGIEDKVGSIEEGKLCDLIVIDKNYFSKESNDEDNVKTKSFDIRNIFKTSVEMVFINGVLVKDTPI